MHTPNVNAVDNVSLPVFILAPQILLWQTLSLWVSSHLRKIKSRGQLWLFGVCLDFSFNRVQTLHGSDFTSFFFLTTCQIQISQTCTWNITWSLCFQPPLLVWGRPNNPGMRYGINPHVKSNTSWLELLYCYRCIDAMLQDKEWFAGDCSRKAAEDLLMRVNKVNKTVQFHAIIIC